MYCQNCGSELKDGAQFCGICGAKTTPDKPTTPESPKKQTAPAQASSPAVTVEAPKEPKKKPKKGIYVVVGLVVVLIVAAVVALQIFNNPTVRMNRAISAGNLTEAYKIYRTELNGKELQKDSIEAIQHYVDGIVSDYENGNMTYDSVTSALKSISMYFGSEISLYSYISDADKTISQQYNYSNYLNYAEEYFENGEYLSALRNYKQALDINAESEEAKTGISKSEEAYRNAVITQADKYISNKDYESAKSVLNDGLTNIPNDSALTEKLRSLSDFQVQNIVDDAYTLTEGGNWEGALEMLEDAQETYVADETISNAYEDIKNKMPMTLKNLTVVSSEHIETITDVVKDRYGNVYNGSVCYNMTEGDAFGLYNLSGKYSTFKATAFVSEDTSNDSVMSISIYVDEELIFFKDEINNETPPLDITIDVTDGQTLRIVVKRISRHNTRTTAKIHFGNSSFIKTEE